MAREVENPVTEDGGEEYPCALVVGSPREIECGKKSSPNGSHQEAVTVGEFGYLKRVDCPHARRHNDAGFESDALNPCKSLGTPFQHIEVIGKTKPGVWNVKFIDGPNAGRHLSGIPTFRQVDHWVNMSPHLLQTCQETGCWEYIVPIAVDRPALRPLPTMVRG
jgi:hypothetical protein